MVRIMVGETTCGSLSSGAICVRQRSEISPRRLASRESLRPQRSYDSRPRRTASGGPHSFEADGGWRFGPVISRDLILTYGVGLRLPCPPRALDVTPPAVTLPRGRSTERIHLDTGLEGLHCFPTQASVPYGAKWIRGTISRSRIAGREGTCCEGPRLAQGAGFKSGGIGRAGRH